jgi:serine/threonine protein kinase/tetratricopeptide (TPR) repeat protein
MTQRLLCHHGHRFEGSATAELDAVCPLCGSVTKRAGASDTAVERRDQTLDIGTSKSRADKNQGLDQTMALEGAEEGANRTTDHGQAQAAVTVRLDTTVDFVDKNAGEDADGTKATSDLEPNALRAKANDAARVDKALDGDQRTTAAMQTESEQTEPPDLPGYEIVDELGRGGMGIVYRARDEKLGRNVALKTLQRINPIELQRFKQEFRSLANIAHPNLATLYDLVSDGQTWCFTMELLEAVEFLEYVWSGFDRLDKNGPVAAPSGGTRLSAPIIARLTDSIKQLALGLHALHEKGVLHRDIKPSNVLVTREGQVVLVDFGLAAEIQEGDGGVSRRIQGTPEYMAPEQAAAKPTSPASDWYAAGVMLYEILTGRLPVEGTPVNMILKKQTAVPKAPRELDPSISQDLSDLCQAMLDLDPAKRPTAADVLRCVGADKLADELSDSGRTLAIQTTELVGREEHLGSLRESFEQVVAGGTKSVFVHGRSGMGKSVLIQKFLDEVKAQGAARDSHAAREQIAAVVLTGRCYEQESVPFKALDSLIDSLATHLGSLPESDARQAIPEDSFPLVRLFPVLGQAPGATDAGKPSIDNVDQQELRQRAMNALRELLKRLGERQPLVLYIDDLQWGDDDSANVLADLMRPPDGPRVLALGSFRAENRETSLCLRALDTAYTTGQHHPDRAEIAVDSLEEADATRLALMLLDRDDDAAQSLAAKIARESRGWPFFVWELAQHVQDDPDIANQSLELDEVIWARVNRLPDDAKRLLELVAVSGRPITASVAYQALGAAEKGRSFLAQLRTSNFVRTTEAEDADTIVETYHDRVRESVVDHLDRDTVMGYNRQLGLTIEQVSGIQVDDLWDHINSSAEFEEPGDPYSLGKRQWQRVFDLASFFDAAGEHDRAFPFALCAAEQARKQDAQEVAEQQFQIALRGCSRLSAAVRCRVHEGLGDVFVLRGKYDEAIEQLQLARALVDGKLPLARLDLKLGDALFKKGDVGGARDYSERAIKALGERPPSKLTALPKALKEAVVQVLHTKLPSRFVGQRDATSKAAKLDLLRARIFDQLTFSYWFSAGMNLVLWSHLRQMNVAERYPASPELGKTYAFHAVTMTGIPMAERGIRYAERAYQISVDDGDLWGQGMARCYHTFACIVLGRFHEGVKTGDEAVRLLEQAGDVWQSNMARMIATVPTFHLGDLKTAYREAKKAYEIAVECRDYSGVTISLLFWAPNSPHTLPPGAIEQELKRERDDPVPTFAAIYARGLELLLKEDNPREAAVVLQDCLDSAKKRGVRNVCLFSAATWKATALRIAAERESGPSARRLILRDAKKAVRAALRITKSYVACRPHALREAGLIAALEGREVHARRHFEESLSIGKQYNASYDMAGTNLAYGEAGIRFAWPNAEQQAADAQASIGEIEDVEGD